MKKLSIEIKWAVIFVIMSLLWMTLEKLSGLHDEYIDRHAIYTNFIAIPAIGVYVFALMEKKKKAYKGIMSYKQGLIAGLIITLIVTILSPLSQLITSNIITPGFFPNAVEYAVSSGYLGREEAEKYFTLENYIVQGLMGAPVMGLLTSAVVAVFIRTKKEQQ